MELQKLQQLSTSLSKSNPQLLFAEYSELFRGKYSEIPIRKIKRDDEYFRARIGCMLTSGSIDDLDIDIPYFGKDIGATPPILE